MRSRFVALAVACRLAGIVVAFCVSGWAAAAPQVVVPLAKAHSHNDYLHPRPLLDALDQGFTSVEADIFPVDGKLLVGHTRNSLKPDRTLEALYLQPLAERVRENGGRVFKGSDRFFLLIDIKRNPQDAYHELKPLLAKYREMLTSVEAGKVRPGAVTVVLTGYTPQLESAEAGPRFASLDGRVADLESQSPADVLSMISDNWTTQFRWNGKGPMPESEREKLQKIVTKAHAAGRIVRFWAAPENEDVWRELNSAGVDLINTDQLSRLAKFLRESGGRPTQAK